MNYSAQRDCIVNFLMGTKAHPTAETVYENVKLTFPRISLGTVYRNLNQLVEHGEIQKLSCGDGLERFDYTAAFHPHFFCRICHSLSDVSMPYMSNLDELFGMGFGGEVEGHSLMYYGVCEKCKNLKKTLDTQ